LIENLSMSCSSTKKWLMQAALPEELADSPADVADHLRQCDECQRLVQRLHRLEHSLRDHPIPASAMSARDGFLLRHDGVYAKPSLSKSAASARYRAVVLLALAALALSLMLLFTFAGGMAAWFISSKRAASELAKQQQSDSTQRSSHPTKTEPASDKTESPESAGREPSTPLASENDVIARLIDMNLQMSDEASAEARGRIYKSRVAALKSDVAKLPDQDRSLAEMLVQDGEWLATNTEPLDQADRFTALADQLVDRIDSASDDANVAARMVNYYQYVSTRGISAKLDRATKTAATDEASAKRMEKIRQREAKRLLKLERLQASAPAAVKKEIRKLLEQNPPKTKPKKRQRDGVPG
jgi:hypothetical protein